MKSTEHYEYSIVNNNDTSYVYEPDIETRELAREAKKEWKAVDKDAVILQTKITKEFKIVR